MSTKITQIEARLQTTTQAEQRVALLNDLAYELRLSDPSRGLKIVTEAIELAQESDNRKGLAAALTIKSMNCSYLSQFDKALEYGQRALALFEEIGDGSGRAWATNQIGNYYLRMGDPSAALQHLHMSLRLYRENDEARGEASALNNIGNVHMGLCDYETSLDYYHQSLARYDELDDKYGTASVLGNIGIIHAQLCQHAEAVEYHSRAHAIKCDIGDRHGQLVLLNNQGDLWLEMADYEKAVSYYRESLLISEEIKERVVKGHALHGLGRAFHGLGRDDEALKSLLESLNMAREVGDKGLLQGVFESLGRLYGHLERRGEGVQCLLEAATLAREMGSTSSEAQSHAALAEAYQRQAELQKALDHYKHYHDLDKQVFNEATAKRRQSLLIQFRVEQAEKEATIYRLKNVELAEANTKLKAKTEELEEALAKIRTLRGLIPICANCKKVRNDQGYWEQVEVYVRDHTQADFTHSLCEECAKELYPDFSEERPAHLQGSGEQSLT